MPIQSYHVMSTYAWQQKLIFGFIQIQTVIINNHGGQIMSLHSQNIFFHQAPTHNKNGTKSKQKDHALANHASIDKKFHNIKVSDIVNHAYKMDNTKKNVDDNFEKVMNDEIQKNKDYKKVHHHDNVKNKNKLSQYTTMKRPQTPDPVSSTMAGQQTVKYPKPEIILKQIERNVNVLKQMYFASLSQHRSTSQNQSDYFQNCQALCKSQQNNPNEFSHEALESERNSKNSKNSKQYSSINGFNKKSIPEISIAPNYNPHNKNIHKVNKNIVLQSLKNSYQKQEDQLASIKGTEKISKPKRKDAGKNQEMNKSRQKLENNNLNHKRKSVSNLQKSMDRKQINIKQKVSNQKIYQPAKTSQQNAIQNNEKNPTNINSLFQIFKFYKRSIDSSLSRQSSKANIANSNSQTQKQAHRQQNIYISHENHNSLNEKSYGKDTPNNSTTKNTTNHKNSTNSRIGGSSIQPSMEISIEQDPFINQKINKQYESKKSRNNSKSSSAKKRNQNETVINKKNLNTVNSGQSKPKSQKTDEKLRKTAKSINHKQSGKQIPKNYMEQITNKKSKHNKKQLKITTLEQTAKEGKNIKRKSKQKQIFDNKISKKKTNLKREEQYENEQVKIEKPMNKRIQNKEEQNECMANLQFPQIQSSAFNRNMPILEEDSQQEASSSLIAVNTQRDDHVDDRYRQEGNMQQSGTIEFSKHKNMQFVERGQNQQIEQDGEQQQTQSLKHHKQQFVLSHSNKKVFIKIEQNTRFPTPSFVTSDLDDQIEKYPKVNDENIDKEVQKNTILAHKKIVYICENKYQTIADDSLAGCQIPKRESDSLDLQNFELVSFEL